MNWWGITQHRSWFKPKFSTLSDNSSIKSAEAFAEASEVIRKNPLKQATSSNYFIDWEHFHKQIAKNRLLMIGRRFLDIGNIGMLSCIITLQSIM